MNNYLKISKKALDKASKIILDYYQKQNFTISKKQDKSPVTEADKKAESIIIAEINKYFPDHGFLGEESGETNTKSKYTWIIDPIDGTKNFMRQIPYFSTLLALKEDDKIIFGISYNPVLKDELYAIKGKGAFYNGQRISVGKIKKLDEAWICHGGLNRIDKKGLVKGLIKLSHDCGRIRGFGDYWMYELLSQGKFDIVIEGETHFWDIAPFILIIEESGGIVTDHLGKPLDVNSTTVIASNKILHPKVIKYFSKS